MPKTFAQKLADAKALGDQADAANEEIVAEFLNKAGPTIQMLRDISANMSPDISFTASAKQILQNIDIGLLKDPLSTRVLAKAAQAAQGSGEAPSAET